jgi:hypothetical protein
MGRLGDFGALAALFVLGVAFASTLAVAYLDYLGLIAEYEEKVQESLEFQRLHCAGQKTFPELVGPCHARRHLAYDDAAQRARREVLSRWSLCDSEGCDALASALSRFFSLGVVALCLAVGGWCAAMLYRVKVREITERLPTRGEG